MPRTITVTIPKAETDSIVAELRQIDGLVGLRVQRDTSLQPPGDVIAADVVNKALNPVMQLLDKRQIGQRKHTSVSTSEPTSIISSSFDGELTKDTNDAIWEEMETTAVNESNMTANMLIMMMLSGIIAAIGILTNAVHVVVGAMIIAPGFVPITRMALGFITKSGAFKRGLADTLKGYVALMLGAAATMLAYKYFGELSLQGKSSYLETGELTSYWTSITASSIAASAAAAVAGGVLIATKRSVLTSGVMIALALIPAASLCSMALVAGEYSLGLKAFIRLLIDLGLVLLLSYAVLAWKKKQIHNREMML